MQQPNIPQGLWQLMLTPFRSDNAVDHEALKRLTDFYIKAGAKGLYANCLSSEMYQLTAAERLAIVETSVRQAGGRVPVVATGNFGGDLQENADFMQKMYDLGVEAVVINTNQLPSAWGGGGDFRKDIEQLMAATGNMPLGLYECPVPAKRQLSTAELEWLGSTGLFFFYKETSCHFPTIEQKLTALEGSPIKLINANTPTGLASLRHGAHGLTTIGANFYPEFYAFLVANYRDIGQQSLIAEISAFLSVMDTLIHQYYPYSAKLFLQKRGVGIESVARSGMPAIPSEDLQKLDELLVVIGWLAERWGIGLWGNR